MRKKKQWSPEEDAVLRERYADAVTAELAEMFSTTVEACYRRAAILGLHKSREYVRRTCNPGGRNGMKAWFQPGHPSFNKGKRQYQYMSPEALRLARSTQFKPGHHPYNESTVGYESLRADGYVWIKVSDSQKMVQKHRYVWKQHNGEIPKGCLIAFRDGDRTNCDLSNLYLTSREESARLMQLSLSPEERKRRNEKRDATRREIIRKDKMRIRWGLEPRTRLVKHWYPYEPRTVQS